MEALYRQHTEETGQTFTPEALERLWELSGGQPRLVNALGYETCFRMKAGRDRQRPITAAFVDEARENLILRRDTHLDQLADKLQEKRVRRVIEPLLAGNPPQHGGGAFGDLRPHAGQGCLGRQVVTAARNGAWPLHYRVGDVGDADGAIQTNAIQEAHQLLSNLSRAEKAQLLQWVVRDLGDAFPGIESIAGVCGGDPCIVRTRIPVWVLVQARRLGSSEADLLRAYPALHAEDLVNAWAYYRTHRDEIEQQIREHEAD